MMALVVVVILFAFFLYLKIVKPVYTWLYPNSLIVEAVLIGSLFTGNLWLYHREAIFTRTEVMKRANDILDRLEKHGLNVMQVCGLLDAWGCSRI